MTQALAGSNIDLRGLSPEDVSMMLSGGLNLGKMRADQVIAQAASDIATRKDAVANAKLALDEKKADIKQAFDEKRITLQEARDRERQAASDAQISISQGMLGVAMRNADVASRRADIADKATRDANAPKPTTPAEQLKMDQTMAGVEAAILSGKAGDTKLPKESIDAYVSMYNKNDPNMAYVKSVSKPKVLLGREVPGTGGDATYTKVPKTQRIRVQSPDGKIGSVSAGSLQEALNTGYKQVD